MITTVMLHVNAHTIFSVGQLLTEQVDHLCIAKPADSDALFWQFFSIPVFISAGRSEAGKHRSGKQTAKCLVISKCFLCFCLKIVKLLYNRRFKDYVKYIFLFLESCSRISIRSTEATV